MKTESPGEAQLPDHIAGLLKPDAYPHPVEHVELIQTHISYVLMAGDMVYKLKKPLDLGFLNFTTLRRRHYYCRQEVELNRRLCGDTYLGVVPVTRQGRRYRLDGRGEVIDYAVQMRRLPSDRMMDRVLADGRLTPEMLERLADKIARFHASSATGPQVERYGSPRTIERNWRENIDQTRPFVGRTLSSWQADFIEAAALAFLTRHRHAFEERVRAGRIRDCHGDLRASAVCFTDDICVYDCIEFNRRFRYADVASEVAFLAMDLDRRGRPDLADRFVARYQQTTGDDDLLRVLNFYKCYRAYVRGKVNSFQLDEPEIAEAAKATARTSARHYFELACRYAASDRLPIFIIMTGLSGTGKSAVASALAAKRDLAIISSDIVRKELAGIAEVDHQYEAYERGVYSREFTQQTYAALLDRARQLLAEGRSVIVDATFQRREWREQAFDLARQAGALVFCLETVADESIVRQRLVAREHDQAAISDARWETYLSQASRFEPVMEVGDWQHICLDTGQPFGDVVASAMNALEARLHPVALSGDRF
ncbi:MAG TPA: AAA family ATPase [Thermomicrobiales bacterium]|nr:AAA family ATPase [Thermomicrobiales bacterium]